MRPLLLLIPSIAIALSPQRPQEAAPPPALVSLNIVALDSKGQSVTDLSADDFRITDNGKPQKVVSFRQRDARPSAVAALGPRQYANRAGNTIPHATVILFDQLNMQFADRGYVTDQLIRGLRPLESAENLYLYLITTNGALYPVHGLPGSGGEPAKDENWTRDIQARLNEAVRITLAHRPTELAIDIDARVRATFEVLSVVAARLAAVPGRKNIVWLTHGVPIALSPVRTASGDWVDYTPYINQLSQTLDRADVSIYAVQQSPPGTAANQDVEAAQGAAPLGSSAASSNSTSPFAGMGSEQTLDQFASLTGGRAYQNNDIAGAVKQAINDARQSYLVTYAPPPENWDGKYHKLRVTCARKGVKVQTRQGYFAFAEQAASGKQEDSAFEAAIMSPFDAAEIGLRGDASNPENNRGLLRLDIRVDISGVHLTQAGGDYSGELAVRFAEYLADGSVRQSKPAVLDLKLNEQQRGAVLKDGYLLTQSVTLAPGVEKIRCIVFDRATSAIGSLTVPVGK